MLPIEVFARLGGITPAFGSRFIPMPEIDIHELEAKLNARLPTMYRAFLAAYGAAALNNYIDFTPAQPFPRSRSSSGKGHFSLFYGALISDYEVYSLAWNVERYSGRMPSSIIPIGGDGGGDQICMGLYGNGIGNVYYWDSQCEPLDEDTYLVDYGHPMPDAAKFQNVHLLAILSKIFSTGSKYRSRAELQSDSGGEGPCPTQTISRPRSLSKYCRDS